MRSEWIYRVGITFLKNWIEIMNSFVIRTPLGVNAAKMVRNTLSKYVYFTLREFIIRRINNAIKNESSTNTLCIGILDMPGFGK